MDQNTDIYEQPDGVTGYLPGSGNIDNTTYLLALTKSTPPGSRRAGNRSAVLARKPSPAPKMGASVGALPINPSTPEEVKSPVKRGNVRRGTLEVSIGNFRIINPEAPTQTAKQALSGFHQSLDSHYANKPKHLLSAIPADTDSLSQTCLPCHFAIESIILDKYAVALNSQKVNEDRIVKAGDPDERNILRKYILRKYPTVPLEFPNRKPRGEQLESSAVSSTSQSSQGSPVRRRAVDLTSIDKKPILIMAYEFTAEKSQPRKTLDLSPTNRRSAVHETVDLSNAGSAPGEYIKIILENPARKQPVDEVVIIERKRVARETRETPFQVFELSNSNSKYKALDFSLANFERKQNTEKFKLHKDKPTIVWLVYG